MEMEGEQGVVMGERDFWFEKEEESTLLDMNGASVLFGDFPSLPELPCMSSSSSSTAPAAAQTIAATTPSSSSAASFSPEASWAVLPKRRRNQSETGYAAVVSSTTATDTSAPPPLPSERESILDADCVDVMENLGFVDLIDSNDLWDPSSLFENQESIPGQEEPAAPPKKTQCQEDNDGFSFLRENQELSMIFLDWLKQNKDHISAEDVRKIKLNRSTIENASKRLGRTKDGMKRLLKLILEWVENHQLQKSGGLRPQYQENPGVNPTTLVPISNFSCINVFSPDISNPCCFPPAPCMIPVPTPQVLESATVVPPSPGLPSPAVGYCNFGGATYSKPPLPVPPPPAYHQQQQVMNMMPGTPSSEYQMMNNAQSWTPTPYSTMPMSPQFSHSTDNSHPISSYQHVFMGNNHQNSAPNGETLVRSGSSATKEARKNRMARQKRLYSSHHRQNNHKNQMDGSHLVGDPISSPEDCMFSPVADPASTPPTDSVPIPQVDASEDQVKLGSMQLQDFQGESYLDRPQNDCSKTERNLRFLMQKVLKQSDVGNLGRIVLPKSLINSRYPCHQKEAENHLPELETRDGVTIAMEDIGASRVWNMRYRFWPNNKSRMYLLENTGDFVKVNGLQEGDFIVIYLDTKCNKYMIRGVKVRQPEAKSDAVKPAGRRNAQNLLRARIRSSSERAVT